MKIILFLISLLLNCSMYTQNLNDTIFNNVIEITDRNVVSNGTDFLFDISIPRTLQTPVVFIRGEVPLKILPNIYPTFSKLIVITPNWTYYDEISDQHLYDEVTCHEPLASSIVYELNRTDQKPVKDSLVIMGGFPKMNLVKKVKQEISKVEVYYSVEYGSACCPKDPKWEFYEVFKDLVLEFENSSKVKIGKVYKKLMGKEGEHILYFTLSQLNDKQKLKFLNELECWEYFEQYRMRLNTNPQVYTPKLIDTEGLELITIN